MSLPLFIVPGPEVSDKSNLEIVDLLSSSEALIEYMENLRRLETSEEVNRQIRRTEEALAGNYLKDIFIPKWGR